MRPFQSVKVTFVKVMVFGGRKVLVKVTCTES